MLSNKEWREQFEQFELRREEELEQRYKLPRQRDKRFPAGALKQRRTPKVVREDGKRNKVSPRVKGVRE